MRSRLILVPVLLGLLVAAPAVAASERASRLESVRIVSVTSPASAGSYATLTARVSSSSVTCRITVYYKSGPSEASGLGLKRPRAGKVSWRWKVGSRTTPGRWRIVVDCGTAGSASTYFRVT